MVDERLAGRSGRFTDAIAALQVAVNLEPGEAKTIVFTLGMAEDGKEDVAELVGGIRPLPPAPKLCKMCTPFGPASSIPKKWKRRTKPSTS
jgi:cellobiose phosphorylase